MQFEFRIVGGRQAQQRGIDRAQRLDVDINGLGYQPKVDRPAWPHHVGGHRRLRVHLYAVMRSVFGDQRKRQNNRHVVLGLLRQYVALVQFPEVRVTGPFNTLLHVAGPTVVRRHG